ncbi:MAG: L-2-hydroxyglutarate oxidase [Acidobacteria bacterium]|nr:L-2-hydroxyglutarate oxidase [Acidobacteriota bacterium]
MERRSVVIVGAGIIGLATALELSTRFPGLNLIVLEKEASVASHQTGHNSGVIHSGIYYKPGSLKATLCVGGARRMIAFCTEHEIPFERCGKLIVATVQSELPQLHELYRRGIANGLKGLRILSSEEIQEIEPFVSGVSGIHVPETAIVDFKRVAMKIAELITLAGGTIRLSTRVEALRRAGNKTVLITSAGELEADLVINCAGLQSDRVSRMAGAQLDLQIVPFRGEYYDVVSEQHHRVRGLIYPVPDPNFPFLGVHFTRRIGGGVEAGPNAVLALDREGYSKLSFSAKDISEYLSFFGFWKLARKHWRMSLDEMYRSWSKPAFVRALQRLMPTLAAADLKPGGTGVRAQALARDGKLIDDFAFAYTDGMVHVCNVPSPAATASFAIANHIVDVIATDERYRPAVLATVHCSSPFSCGIEEIEVPVLLG